jgi:hypothetical protein
MWERKIRVGGFSNLPPMAETTIKAVKIIEISPAFTEIQQAPIEIMEELVNFCALGRKMVCKNERK